MARINEALPGNKINITSDLVIDAGDRIPGLNTFLQVLVGLGAFVSTIFVLLSMYTTITERRKEIGIQKSLGASHSFIIRTIEGEALMIGILGIILGFLTAFLASQMISRQFELAFEYSIKGRFGHLRSLSAAASSEHCIPLGVHRRSILSK